MTKDNKTVTNRQIFDKLDELIDMAMKIKITTPKVDTNDVANKVVTRMTKLKSMEDWFHHVSNSEVAWSAAYKDLKLTVEEEALGEAAKLMTLMEMFKSEEEYEKCAIIRARMDEVNKILKRKKK